MRPIFLSIFLLACSNIFMTFAWYVHLKEPGRSECAWASLCMIGAASFMFRSRLA